MRVESNALSRQTAKAGFWSIGARILAKAVDFAALIFLARFLGPGDFGLVAMAMTMIFIVEAIFELPLSAAMMRIAEATTSMYETAFTLSTMRGVAIGTILGAAAWPMAYFYNEPRLIPLVMALALAPIMRGLISPRMVDFAKRMDFRRQAFLDVLSKLIAGVVSVTLAALTQSYWSLAIGTILTPVVLAVGSYVMAPLRPRLTLKDWPIFADIVGWNMLSQILQAIHWQVGRFVLPRYVDTVSFGRYAMASDLSGIPYQTLIAPLGFPLNVAFVSAHQNGNIKATYLKSTGAIAMLVAPIYSFLGVVSAPLIDLFLGFKWQGAAILLTGLAVSAIIQAPAMPMPSLAVALNQSRQITLRSLVQCLTLIPLTIVGVTLWGVFGAVLAACAVGLLISIMSMITVKTLIAASYREQLEALAGPSVAALVSGALLFYATGFIRLDEGLILLASQIAIVGVLYVAIYTACIYLISLRFKSTAGAEHLVVSMALNMFSKIRRPSRGVE